MTSDPRSSVSEITEIARNSSAPKEPEKSLPKAAKKPANPFHDMIY